MVMKTKAIIVEDEFQSAELLEEMINNLYADIDIVAIADNIEDAIKEIHNKKPQIVFLDININSRNGFEVVRNTNSSEYELIITTAYSKYAIQAIKNSAVDFLLKPYDFKDLKEAVSKARQQLELKEAQKNRTPKKENKKRLSLPTNDGFIVIDIDEISTIKANSNNSEFTLIDGSIYSVSKSISDYENLLAEFGFFRPHKSFLINIREVMKYEKGRGGSLFMSDGTEIPVSKNKKMDLLKILDI